MKKLLTVLACGLLLAVAVPGSSADQIETNLPGPVPAAHPALGSTAGCTLTGAGVYYGYFQDPAAEDAACQQWNPDGFTSGIDVFELDCAAYCYVGVWGQDANGNWGDWYVECADNSGGVWVFTDDPLANLLLESSSYGTCWEYEYGVPVNTLTSYNGYVEDWNFSGIAEISAAAHSNWLDGFIDGLL